MPIKKRIKKSYLSTYFTPGIILLAHVEILPRLLFVTYLVLFPKFTEKRSHTIIRNKQAQDFFLE